MKKLKYVIIFLTLIIALATAGAWPAAAQTLAWSPMNSHTEQRLQEVWGSSASDVFAVGDNGTVLHYDGHDWSPMDSGTTANLLAIWEALLRTFSLSALMVRSCITMAATGIL